MCIAFACQLSRPMQCTEERGRVLRQTFEGGRLQIGEEGMTGLVIKSIIGRQYFTLMYIWLVPAACTCGLVCLAVIF